MTIHPDNYLWNAFLDPAGDDSLDLMQKVCQAVGLAVEHHAGPDRDTLVRATGDLAQEIEYVVNVECADWERTVEVDGVPYTVVIPAEIR